MHTFFYFKSMWSKWLYCFDFLAISDWVSSKLKYSFTATRSSAVNIYNQQTLIFNNVHSNVGNIYNPTFGHFAVPVNGTYLIGVTIVAQAGKYLNIFLMKDKTQVHQFYFGDSSNGYPEADYVSLVLELAKGDVLYVQGRNNPDYVHGGSTFSGVLLYT